MRRRTAVHAVCAAALTALAAGPAGAAAAVAGFDPGASEIVFTTRQLGAPVQGRFTRFSAELALDPRALSQARVALTVETASARFGTPELDGEVAQPGWLSAQAFPQATFRATGLQPAGAAGRYEVQGTLTLKGTARALRVPLAVAQAGGITTVTGSFTLPRLAFRIGEGEWAETSLLADEVQVRFRLVFTGLALP